MNSESDFYKKKKESNLKDSLFLVQFQGLFHNKYYLGCFTKRHKQLAQGGTGRTK